MVKQRTTSAQLTEQVRYAAERRASGDSLAQSVRDGWEATKEKLAEAEAAAAEATAALQEERSKSERLEQELDAKTAELNQVRAARRAGGEGGEGGEGGALEWGSAARAGSYPQPDGLQWSPREPLLRREHGRLIGE